MNQAILLVAVIFMVATGCVSPSRERSFEPSPAGAHEAGQRILAMPAGTYVDFWAEISPEPVAGPAFSFVRLASSVSPDLRQGARDCRNYPERTECDMNRRLEAVFTFDRSRLGPNSSVYDPSLEGMIEAINASQSVDIVGERRAYAILPIAEPASPSLEYNWVWRRFRPLILEADFTCYMDSDVLCLHRTDVAGFGVIVSEDQSFERVEVGNDLAESYARALSVAGDHAARVRIFARKYIPLGTAGYRHNTVAFRSIDSIGTDEICGSARPVSAPGFDELCLSYDHISRFGLRDVNLEPREIITDVVSTPFRVLGAVALATAMMASAE